MNKKSNAIIYTRVSSVKQDNDGNSPKRQKESCLKFCEQSNINVKKTFHDAHSGKVSKERPKLQEAIKYSINNDIEYFIIYDIDRFSREGYSVYSDLKKILSDAWVKLRDSKNIIWETQLAIKNEKFDMSEYNWNKENPTEMSEMVHSAQAKMEWNKILQRMVGKEIELEQEWYSVRDSNLGYKNKKIRTYDWKKTIQVKDEFAWSILLEWFIQRGECIKSDIEIVDEMNAKGLRTKYWNKITVKYFQTLIKNPIYAWVIISKWNSYKPIRTAYDWLMNIDIWNKANKRERSIIELENWDIEFIEWNKDILQDTPKRRRKKFNTDLPFRNLILSSVVPGKYIWWSGSNPSRNKPTLYYHPVRWPKTIGIKCENIAKEEFENSIISVFQEIQINGVVKIIFEERFEQIFENNKERVNRDIKQYQEQLQSIKKEIDTQENKICSIDSWHKRIFEAIEKRLWFLEKEKTGILEKIEKYNSSWYSDPENFKKFCFYLIEHLSDLLIQSKSHEELSTLFKFVFKKTPTWNEINNRTFEIYPIFALQSKKEPQIIWSSSVNRKWQAH